MCVRKVSMDRLQNLVWLHRMKTGSRDVARMLRMSPNTERKYRLALARAGLLQGDPNDLPAFEVLKEAVNEYAPVKKAPQQESSVEKWADEIEKMLDRNAKPKAIYDALCLQQEDFTGSLSAVKRLCLRIKQEKGIQPEDVAIPVETEPGEVAQVDFGYVGKLFDPVKGALRKAWAFVMVLGYSRHMVVRVVFNQRTETWLQLHIEACEELGCVPAVIVPDNLKAAVIKRAFGLDEGTSLNRSYRELAQHYGFKIDPTPPRAPEKKGKVESGVKYVKNNFFKPRGVMEVDLAREELARWVREIAGNRIHGTTNRRPLEVFEQDEQQAMLPLPDLPFEMVVWKKAKVHTDCHVSFDRRLYSVPWKLVGRQVWIRATDTTIAIYFDDERVATHSRRAKGYRSTCDTHMPEHRVALRHRSREYWEKRADRLGDEVGAFIREVFDSDDVLSRLRQVQGIVTYLENFPAERARAACARAQYYGNYSYQGLKAILRKALDLEPLPTEAQQDPWGRLDNPRYARRPAEILQLPLEATHASH
jgi:transposase